MLFISLLAALRTAAQTCTGGLGDPIVDITFGQGAVDGGPLKGGSTNLTFNSADCPNDGYYTITPRSTNCFGGTWWTVTQDHTGNPDGNFMLINASYQPSVFFVKQVSGLCGGTSYQFSTWVLNMVQTPNYILPNITFTIEKLDGQVLQSYSTGDIPETTAGPEWKQYAFYFATPPGIDTVVLRMANNAPGGLGNDLGLDDITFRPAGASVQVGVIGFGSDSITFCSDAQSVLTLNANVQSCSTEDVQWQQSSDSGQTWNDILGANSNSWNRAVSGPGVYLYRLAAAQPGNLGIVTCEVASSPVQVDVIAIPTPAIGVSSSVDTVCAGSVVKFTAKPVNGGSDPQYQWVLNTQLVGNGADTLALSNLQNGDQVSCIMTSDAVCVEKPVAQSAPLQIPVVAIPVTGVNVVPSATQVCADSLVVFTATAENGGNAPVYAWQVNGKNAGGDTAVFASSDLQNGDVVNCIMTGSLECSKPVGAAQVVKMTIYPLPVIDLDSAVIIGGGSSIRLQPVITGNIASWTWTPATGLDDPIVADPLAAPVGNTDYALTVITTNGCVGTASEKVEVYYDVRMPAAFTPNGDGRNDVFRVPPSFPVTINRLAVYNRQGAMLFYTTNVANGWDGTYNGQPQPAGVYVWAVEYNNPLTKRVGEKKGTVVLVR